MKVVVITGGIGSGKSMACRYLAERYGWPVYEADRRVKELYLQHPTLLSDIEDCLGVKLRNAEGCFVPQFLAAVIFNDPHALSQVEDIVFPVLTDDFQKWKVLHKDCCFGVLESATILEKPQLKNMGDFVVLIDAPIEIRTGRAASRDGVPSESIIQRMQNQTLMNAISKGEAESPSDSVIINDGTPAELERKIDILVEKLV